MDNNLIKIIGINFFKNNFQSIQKDYHIIKYLIKIIDKFCEIMVGRRKVTPHKFNF